MAKPPGGTNVSLLLYYGIRKWVSVSGSCAKLGLLCPGVGAQRSARAP